MIDKTNIFITFMSLSIQFPKSTLPFQEIATLAGDKQIKPQASMWQSWYPTLKKVAMVSCGILAVIAIGSYVNSQLSPLPHAQNSVGNDTAVNPSTEPVLNSTNELFESLKAKRDFYLNSQGKNTTSIMEAALNPNITLDQLEEIVKQFPASYKKGKKYTDDCEKESEFLEFKDSEGNTALQLLLDTTNPSLTKDYHNWDRLAILLKYGAKGFVDGNRYNLRRLKYVLQFAHEKKIPAAFIEKVLAAANYSYANEYISPDRFSYFLAADIAYTSDMNDPTMRMIGLFAQEKRFDVVEKILNYRDPQNALLKTPTRDKANPVATIISNGASDDLIKKALTYFSSESYKFCQAILVPNEGESNGLKKAFEILRTKSPAVYHEFYNNHCKKFDKLN